MRKFICMSVFLAGASHAQDAIQPNVLTNFADQAVNHPINGKNRPQYVLSSPRTKWPAGILYWYYNPASQPANLTTDEVVTAIKRAASRWMAVCNVNVFYMGTITANPVINGSSSSVDRKNVFGWGYASSQYTLLNRSQWYNNAYETVDTDVVLNLSRTWTPNLIDAAMSSGIGLSLGLGISNVSTAALGVDLVRNPEYDRILRGDDAAGCADLYGAARNADAERAMNWAESAFPDVLRPSPALSGDYEGYYGRYYSGTNSYVLVLNGLAYFMGPDKVMQYMGTVESYKAQVQKAGF